MYAFAIWDRTTRTLLLARDRFGIKPLYYAADARGALRFASELRALLAVPGIERAIDLAATREYLRHLTIPGPTHDLIAASASCRRRTASSGGMGGYGCAAIGDCPIGEPDAPLASSDADDLEQAVVESVALSLRSDEPLGLFLSGGMDSSVLAWAMRKSGSALRTFSVSFAEPHFDEGPHSRSVAAALGSEHHEIRVSKDDAVDAALDVLERFDEPFADSSALPTYILSRTARSAVKAVLAGEGADELFGGSLWHDIDGATASDDALLTPPAKVMFRADELDVLCSPELRAQCAREPYDSAAALAGAMPDGLDHLHRQLCADLTVYLPSDLLAKMDRMSMLHSLEVRVPYLNHSLAEFIWRLPTSAKQRDGVRKHLLRTVAARRLPPAIAARAKQGFAIPMDIWTWQPGRFRDLVYDTLHSDRFRQRGWFDLDCVDTMLTEHDRLQSLHGHRLWTLVVLEHWLRRAW